MIVIEARNVHEALPKALNLLLAIGVKRESRNGPVIVFPEPVCTVYERPTERVVFWPERDANPYFHFIESLWMLAGRNDVAFLANIVKRMKDFSDDGEKFHGAYGYRWRKHFGFDQLLSIIKHLSENTDDRRQVLGMWDAASDLRMQKGKKDLPCNTQAIFSVTHEGNVDMMVTNRSNDLVLGCYGANAVHFSYLHEFVARSLRLPVGVYRQVSNNLHAYDNEDFRKVVPILQSPSTTHYDSEWEGAPLRSTVFNLSSTDAETWLAQLDMFLSRGASPGMDPFFRRVADPILRSHAMYKQLKDSNRFSNAFREMDNCADGPWTVACKQWLERREQSHLRKQAASTAEVTP